MIRILLVDDEALLRGAIGALLEIEHDIRVVAEASDGESAVRLAGEHDPDVVVLDLEMPGIDGIDAATRIRESRPEQAIVILTRHGRPGVLRRALRAGVRGFLSKAVDPGELARVIERVHAGQRYIDAEISTAAMMDDNPLTERELEVLRLSGEGLAIREIGTRLHLASGTVRNYISAAMQKCGAANRYEAARIARERDWL